MTTTTVINAQSFGTGSNVGNGKFSQNPVTLQVTTTAFVVSAEMATGNNGQLDPKTKIRVWYTTTTRTVTAADAPSKLGQTAHYVDVTIDRPVAIRDSMLEPVTGNLFHVWVDAPVLGVAGTITVVLVELP